jgi:hypothetical protein
MIEAELPDGTVLEFPDGTSPDVIQRVVKQRLGATQTPPMNVDPTEGMSGIDRFRAGLGKAFVDVGRGVRQYLPEAVGGMSNDEIAQARKLDAPLMNTGAGMSGNIAGNVALAAPAMLVPGAATIPGAAITGGVYGALQPGVDTQERLKNIAIGGVAGAAVPAAVRGAQVAKSAVEPLYESGRQTIIGRTMGRASGGQEDVVIRALRSGREIVPGSVPTAAEVAQNPGIAALQRTATQSDPVAMNQLAARQVAQNDARIAALQGVTPDVQQAIAAREAAAGPLYEAARQGGFDPAVAQQLAPRVQTLMQRVPDELVAQARNLARIEGVPIDDMGSVQGAHYLKMAIDAQIEQAQRAGNNTAARAYTGLKNEFVSVLDQLTPAYGQARQTFAQMSAPVNQGQVLEEVARRGTNFRGDMTPAAFSRAASDRTAQSVVGRNMDQVLTPQQTQTLQNIQQDLMRSDFAQTAGRGVGSDTVQKMAFNNIMAQSGLPSALQNFPGMGIAGNLAQRFGQVVYRDANERMAQQLAQALLDPQQAAQLMEAGMVTPQMQALVQGLRRGGAATGASTPGIVQANQQ